MEPVRDMLRQPFIWLYVKTEETNFVGEPERIDVTSNFLVSFQEDNVLGDDSGLVTHLTAKLVMFDPSSFYLETLLMLNRRLAIEYGWLNSDGSISQTTGKLDCSIADFKTFYQYQGIKLEVTLSMDRVLKKEENINMVNPLGSKNLAFVWSEDAPPIENYFDASIPEGSLKIRRISDIVKFVAHEMGLAVDVDDTEEFNGTVWKYHNPEVPTLICRLVNRDYESLLKSLIPLARSTSKKVGYDCWNRGGTLYFKLPDALAGRKAIQSYAYGRDNNGTMLSFDLNIAIAHLVMHTWDSVLAVSRDPVSKSLIGIDSRITNNEIREKTLKSAVAAQGNPGVYNVAGTWHYVDSHRKVSPDDPILGVVQENAVASDGNSTHVGVAPSMPTVVSNPLPTTAAGQIIKSAQEKRILAEVAPLNADTELLYSVSARPGNQPNPSTNQEPNLQPTPRKPVAITDTGQSKASRVYVLPYTSDQTISIGRYVHQQIRQSRTFTATASVIGDISLTIHRSIFIELLTDSGLHYGTGTYIIRGVSHRIDTNGFTTELTLTTDGINTTDAKDLTRAFEDVKNSRTEADAIQKAIDREEGFNLLGTSLDHAKTARKTAEGEGAEQGPSLLNQATRRNN